MTEEDAKTKWCPFARLLTHTYAQDGKGRMFEGGYSYNRSPDPDETRAPYLPAGASCIGSACMAWRFRAKAGVANAKAELRADRKINAIKALRESFPEYGLLEARQIIDGDRPWPSDEDGYCGVAGASQ